MLRGIAIAGLMLVAVGGFAQIHGTPPSVTSLDPHSLTSVAPPPSVTSIGFGFPISVAPSPSVTSLGPLGFGPTGPRFGTHFPIGRRSRFGGGLFFGGAQTTLPIVVPFYVPYPAYPLVYPNVMYPVPATPGDYSDTDTDVPMSSAVMRHETLTPDPPPSPPIPAAAATPPPEVREQETTILVFQDGHRLEVRNYAILGSDLYNFSSPGPRKIPLADLDLGATREVNDDRGVQFRIPVRMAR